MHVGFVLLKEDSNLEIACSFNMDRAGHLGIRHLTRVISLRPSPNKSITDFTQILPGKIANMTNTCEPGELSAK